MPRRDRPAYRVLGPWGGGILVALFFWVIIYYSFSPLNPDWLAYQSIYESGGAWLSDQGRDPFFLFIVNGFRSILGADGYVGFRMLIGIYFAVFSGVTYKKICRDGSIQYKHAIFVFMILLNLFLSRFTIQIREGLAVTFLLMGIYLLFNGAHKPRLLTRVCSFSLILLSCLMHSIIFILFIPFMIQYLFHKHIKLVSNLFRKTHTRVMLFVFTLVALYVLLKVLDIDGLLQKDIGDRSSVEVEVSWAKYIFWSFYGLISIFVYRKISAIRSPGARGLKLKMGLKFLAGPVAATVYFLIMMYMATNGSAAVISTLARIYYLILGVSLLYVSINMNFNFIYFLVVLLLLVDQVRIIGDSILMHFGVRFLSF